MKHAMFLRTVVFVFFILCATVSSAQIARPFKGTWSSADLYVNIDFYGKTIPDPNSMDEYSCAGVIRIRPGVDTMTYTIENVKVSGNKATATVYFVERNSNLTFEYQSDGSMKVTSNDVFTYVDDSGQVKLPEKSYTLRRAE